MLPSKNQGARAMSSDEMIAELLGNKNENKVVLEVLKKVADMRSVLFKEILDSIDPKSEERKYIDPETEEQKKLRQQVEDAVRRLMDADLIKERSAAIEDFNSYYVTADGLSTARELRRSKL
jgi:hypothetical protein